MEKYRNINISDYDYTLPDMRVAKYPLPERDSSKLLVYRDDSISDLTFSALPEILPNNTLIVRNNTKVIRARITFVKSTGGRIEVFCLDPAAPSVYDEAFAARGCCEWHCLVGNAKKWRDKEVLTLPFVTPQGNNDILCATRTRNESSISVHFEWKSSCSFAEVLEAVGELPIPPYLHRRSERSDLQNYQTVYAEVQGSVAAPTAGLHFTCKINDALRLRGLKSANITLHVGAGTFRPVKAEQIGDHEMHAESIAVPIDTLRELVSHSGVVLCTGTTTVRTLESLYYMGAQLLEGKENPFFVDQWTPYDTSYSYTTTEALSALIAHLEQEQNDTLLGATRIIIVPGFTFRIASLILTNFHQPHSTLLLLVAAFVGEEWRTIYNHALNHDYRFLSYGDASLLFKNNKL